MAGKHVVDYGCSLSGEAGAPTSLTEGSPANQVIAQPLSRMFSVMEPAGRDQVTLDGVVAELGTVAGAAARGLLANAPTPGSPLQLRKPLPANRR